MIPFSALALALSVAAADPLSAAQEAFSARQYDAAEKLALEAADDSSPRRGAALYLAGLARFRAGRPDEALEALDAAGLEADPPARAHWQFNRAACLYELGRFREAEQAYLEAAGDPNLARVAWANAGFAALDAGALDRAERLADRARVGANEAELALVEDLLAQLEEARTPGASKEAPRVPADDAYRKALAEFDLGRFEEARASFLTLAREDATAGRARLMAGAAAYRLGDRQQAEDDVRASLTLALTDAERGIAQKYLERLSFGLRAQPEGPEAWASVSGGFDGNPVQLGFAQRELFALGSRAGGGSPFTEAQVIGTYRLRPSQSWAAVVSYSGAQRAYASPLARDYSVQLHRVWGAVESAWDRLRVGGSAGGDVAFTGLSAFRGLQASGFGSAWVALDESALTSSRLELAFGRKLGLQDEFSYLTGNRLDLTATQQLRWRSVSASAWYRYRSDGSGSVVLDGAAVSAVTPCTGCTFTFVVPFAYQSHAVGGAGRVQLGSRWELELEAGLERRLATEDSYLRVTGPDGTEQAWNRRRRADTRGWVSPGVRFQVNPWLSFAVGYELVANRSNIGTALADSPGECAAPEYSCHALDPDDGSYDKHLLTFEVGGSW